MMAWALRCLGLTLIAGVAFLRMQSDGTVDRMLTLAGGERAIAAQEVGGEAVGGYLEEVVMAGDRGHFVTDVMINGTPVTFMIDTGASHTILNQADAERLRLPLGRLRYSVPFQSANGTTYAAPVTLRDVRLGHFQLHDLDAYVNRGELNISLLGMSFLRQFESYEFLRDRLVLRW